MDWTNTNKSAFTNRKNGRPDNRPPALPISETEFKLRMERNVCFNCGNAGHLSRNCYYSRPRRNVRVKQILTEPTSIVIHEKGDKDSELPTYDEQLKE